MSEIDVRRYTLIDREARKPGFRGKVNAKCIECIYDPWSDGNWRQQVAACSDTLCPLYSVRPVSQPEAVE